MRAPATRVSYGLPDLAQQKEGGNAVLTEGLGRRMRDAGSAVTLIGGVVMAELADRAMWWSSWLRDSLDWCGVLLRRRWKGQRDRSITGGEQLLEESLTYGGGCSASSAGVAGGCG